jgi:hypothetical protein
MSWSSKIGMLFFQLRSSEGDGDCRNSALNWSIS